MSHATRLAPQIPPILSTMGTGLLSYVYNHETPAEALLFHGAHKALRIEAPDIGREFTDGMYIGTGRFCVTWMIEA